MLNVFDYKNPGEFLRDAWLEKRKVNASFSIRAWAQQLGASHHNPLQEMIKGKRKISKTLIPSLITNLKLTPHEGLYFEIMVDCSRAKTLEEKKLYLERMESLNKRRTVRFAELESFRLLENPLHYFINELVLQADFNSDPLWIKQRLGHKVSVQEIKEAIERLISLGLLKEDSEGHLHRVEQFIQSKSDISDQAIKNSHKKLMELASRALDTQDVLEREFQGMAMNVDPRKMKRMKEDIRQFINEFTAKYDTPKVPGEEVYQLNLQFFGITKRSSAGANE